MARRHRNRVSHFHCPGPMVHAPRQRSDSRPHCRCLGVWPDSKTTRCEVAVRPHRPMLRAKDDVNPPVGEHERRRLRPLWTSK